MLQIPQYKIINPTNVCTIIGNMLVPNCEVVTKCFSKEPLHIYVSNIIKLNCISGLQCDDMEWFIGSGD
jgi:hypothetical protein